MSRVYTYPYPRPMVTVDILVTAGGPKCKWSHVLLIRRANDPYKDTWALPGGYMDEGETLIKAAKRELKEETGFIVQEGCFKYHTYLDDPKRDPRGRTISHVFWVSVVKKEEVVLKAASDASLVVWLPREEIPLIKLAFDHNKIVRGVLE